MNLLLAFILAMGITMVLIPLLMRFAGSMRVLDQPNFRKVHTVAMPRVGGMAMFVGALLPLWLWVDLDRRVVAYLVAAALIFICGVWDDRKQLSATAKLLGQLFAVFIVVYGGQITISSITLTERILLPEFVSVPLTVFFLLGATNAINLADGLDGLAGGTTLLCCAAIGLLAYSFDAAEVATIAIVVSGSILGFLRFNTYPARIFMGDGGSQFLGFTVAVLALMLTQTASVVVSTALPVLLLGLPIVDTLMVMSQRLREGRSPFTADQKHIHHKLLALGFDHHEAVATIYGVQAVFFLAAWYTRYESDAVILGIFSSLAGGVLGLLMLAGRMDWRWRRPDLSQAPDSALKRCVSWLSDSTRLPRWSLIAAVTCVSGYLLAVAYWAERAVPDIAWLGALIGVAVVVGALFSRRFPGYDWLLRGALYMAAVLAVYLDYHDAYRPGPLVAAKWLFLPLLVLAVVIRMRLSSERRFELTTLDVLLIFIAIALPNLPGIAGAPSNIGLSLGKLVALVYGIELCTDHSGFAQRALAAGVFCFAATVVLRSAV